MVVGKYWMHLCHCSQIRMTCVFHKCLECPKIKPVLGLVLASSLPLDVCVHCVHSALLHSAGQEEKLPVCRSSSSRHYSNQSQQNSDDCPLYFLLYMGKWWCQHHQIEMMIMVWWKSIHCTDLKKKKRWEYVNWLTVTLTIFIRKWILGRASNFLKKSSIEPQNF